MCGVPQHPIPHCGQPVLVNVEGRLFSPEAHAAATDFALQSPLLDMFLLIHYFTYCVTNQGAQVYVRFQFQLLPLKGQWPCFPLRPSLKRRHLGS